MNDGTPNARRFSVVGLYALAVVLAIVGVSHGRSCSANTPGHHSSVYWLVAVGCALAVGTGSAISSPDRLGRAVGYGLLAGFGVYLIEALSWVGSCG